jgi:hypothetical protein
MRGNICQMADILAKPCELPKMSVVMKVPILILLFVSCVPAANPQRRLANLPKDALVLETRALPRTARRNRLLVLWMKSPEKHPSSIPADELYTCPDYTRGSYYSGPTKVSLVNTATNTIINTVAVEDENLDLPYAIRPGYYYRVAAANGSGHEARPTIIWLKDYNGDGFALEFALFNAEACMGLDTTLIGYSKRRDRVIHYPIELQTTEGNQTSSRTVFWADYLFSKKAFRAGHWKYEVDYRGRGGTLDRWTARYDRAHEKFYATVVSVPDSDNDD